MNYLDAWSYTEWFNLLGNPAAVVPVGHSPEGLPIGVQIVGRPWEEEQVLAVAAALEKECGGVAAASQCLKEASDTGKGTASVVPIELPSESDGFQLAKVRSVVKSLMMTPRISAALAGIVLAAFGLFARAPQTQPKVANPIEAARQNNLGCAYMNQQLFEKGLKAFQQAAELDPKLAIARLNEAIAFLNLQKVDEAKAALEAALKQDPKNPNAWYNLGLLAKNTGDATAAIDDFKRVTEIDPNDADTWYFLGTAYVQAKQFPQAIEAFQHALQLNPLHASAVVRIVARLPAIGRRRPRPRASEEIPVHHAKQNRRPHEPGLRRAGPVLARGGIAECGVESAGADQGAVRRCDEGSWDSIESFFALEHQQV